MTKSDYWTFILVCFVNEVVSSKIQLSTKKQPGSVEMIIRHKPIVIVGKNLMKPWKKIIKTKECIKRKKKPSIFLQINVNLINKVKLYL